MSDIDIPINLSVKKNIPQDTSDEVNSVSSMTSDPDVVKAAHILCTMKMLSQKKASKRKQLVQTRIPPEPVIIEKPLYGIRDKLQPKRFLKPN